MKRNIDRSLEITKYGRRLTPVQKLIVARLSVAQAFGELLSAQLLAAVDARNVAFFKEVIEILEWRPRPKRDEEAEYLAGLAEMYKATGTSVTLGKLRRMLGGTASEDDGDKALRRKAKLYGVPISAAKRGRKNSRH